MDDDYGFMSGGFHESGGDMNSGAGGPPDAFAPENSPMKKVVEETSEAKGSLLRKLENGKAWEFNELLHGGFATKHRAAELFHNILALNTRGVIRVQQHRPYGKIEVVRSGA